MKNILLPLLATALSAAFAHKIPAFTGASAIEGNITGKPVVHRFGLTRWGETLDPGSVLPEYPRPQLVRKEWLNLNGFWDFTFTPRAGAKPETFERKILVPFPVESQLSGLQIRVSRHDRMWYRRTFRVPESWKGKEVWLRFGAVDWETEVFINGKSVGAHQGGYDPFSFNITPHLSPGGEEEITVGVWDPTEGNQPCGKQKLNPGPIEYTPCSGIWQTVWLEPVVKDGIESLKIDTDIDTSTLTVTVRAPEGQNARITVSAGGKTIAKGQGAANSAIAIPIPGARLWWPHDPFLYDLRVTLGKDQAESYFGMRKSALGKDKNGITRMMLNNRFIVQNGLLDQGYWPDGIYTAPSDDALRHDIEMTKRFGFNLARKHLKVEPARWYCWADRLGLLVWQDMPSANGLQWHQIPEGMPEPVGQYELELRRMIETLRNHPSVVSWVLFNEGLGIKKTSPISQKSREIVTRMVNVARELDPSRLINHESGEAGWERQGKNQWDIGLGDIIDYHCYGTTNAPVPTARASVVGEYGYDLYQKLAPRYAPLTLDPGVSGFIYTQTTDVENEKNGLLTYTREIRKKFPVDEIAALNQTLFGAWMTP